MGYFVIFYMFLAFSPTIFAFFLRTTDNLECKWSHLACLSNTTFTTCSNPDSFTVLTNVVIECPDGYVCDDSTTKPCVLPGSLTSTTEPSTQSSSENTTTEEVSTTVIITTTLVGSTESSTRYTVARPTSAPTCDSSNVDSLYPAEACNQYYVCTKSTSWIIFTKYNADLKTCDDGYDFSSTSLACVTLDQSDCP